MRDFPSCFGENAVQVSDSSSSSGYKAAQNLVTCVYQCRLRCCSYLITVSWSKNLVGQGLSIAIDDSSSQFLCKADIKWVFAKRKGERSIQLDDSRIVHMYWDLTSAKYGSGSEPIEGFYLAIVLDSQTILLLGDMKKEACKKTGSAPIAKGTTLVSRRVNLSGKKVFFTKAKFSDNGQTHEIVVECNSIGDPCLVIRVDRKSVMQVKQLNWKFRGNQTISIDGLPIEVFWDVHNWLFSGSSCSGSAVFMFKTCVSDDSKRLNWTHLQKSRELEACNNGFSLILYAWKQE